MATDGGSEANDADAETFKSLPKTLKGKSLPSNTINEGTTCTKKMEAEKGKGTMQ